MFDERFASASIAIFRSIKHKHTYIGKRFKQKTQNMKQAKLEIEQQGEINDANKSLTARLYIFRKSTLVTK